MTVEAYFRLARSITELVDDIAPEAAGKYRLEIQDLKLIDCSRRCQELVSNEDELPQPSILHQIVGNNRTLSLPSGAHQKWI